MFIDTHCHLDSYENVDEIIRNMQGNIMIISGYNNNSNKKVIEIIEKHNNIYGTIGIHPTEECDEEALEFVERNATNPKIVGIGEIGLDYHYKCNKQVQKTNFIKQIKIAQKYNLPIVIHSRDAALDTYDVLKEYINETRFVLHCYSYSKEMALAFDRLGAYFGIGGVITFKNRKTLKDVVYDLPLDKILLETDSPYLAPEPYRGQINEPKNALIVANEIAGIKKKSCEEILSITTQNAIRQFDLNIRL